MTESSTTAAKSLRISAEDFKARVEAGEAVTVLDVRNPHAWDDSAEKIRGAVRVDPAKFPANPAWPKDRLTVAY